MAQNEYQDEIFTHFNYKVVATFSEYLNDVEQHSYDELTDDWWLSLFSELDVIDNVTDCDTSEIQKNILNCVLAKFPKSFLTDEQIVELKNNLNEAYNEFALLVFSPP